jgi:thiamine-monophosphate kinase
MADTQHKKSASGNGKKPTLSDLGEFGLIEKIRSAVKSNNPNILMGIGDDAALFKSTAGHEMVITADMLVEGRHFDFKTISPWQLGAKTMAVNISDCAAMGAKPTVAVISLGVPKDFPVKDIEAFYEGLNEWGESYGAQVVGGDTFVVSVALVGEVEKGKALRRSKAKAGDALFVTGSLGDSAAGLYALQKPSPKGKETESLLIKRHLCPLPRFNVGRALVADSIASSAIDISDGLSSEIHHLCEESGVGAEIHEEAIPLSPSLIHFCGERELDALSFALSGGEDYELLFTVPIPKISKAVQLPGSTGVMVKSIGRMVPKAKGITLISKDGKRTPLKKQGYDHFSKNI